MRAIGANSAPKEAARRTIRRDTVSTARQSVRSAQSYFIPVSFTTVDQLCASLRMKAENSAGVLVAGNRPEASAFALMAGSAKIFATSPCSLSTMAAGVSLGATSPSQTVISSMFGTSAVMIGRSGTGGERGGTEFWGNADGPALNQRDEVGCPSEDKI